LKSNQITEEKLSKVQRLNDLAQQRGQSLAQMAIAWVLRHPVMTSALIGASKVSQVEECVAALDKLDFSEDELRTVEGILA
jgi:L-glyceraldehyde 3-phosphate reductase